MDWRAPASGKSSAIEVALSRSAASLPAGRLRHVGPELARGLVREVERS